MLGCSNKCIKFKIIMDALNKCIYECTNKCIQIKINNGCNK